MGVRVDLAHHRSF